jgi:flagellar motor switch protein FliN/FliY
MHLNQTPEQLKRLMSAPGAQDGALAELTSEARDILGEVGNISMGTAATTMCTILDRTVNITTPKVFVYPNLSAMLEEYTVPYIIVEVEYTKGVTGRGLLLLKDSDAAMITDIMMGGDGNVDLDHIELDEVHMSAISEIMNQMIASGATSLAQIFGEIVDISPPKAALVDLSVDEAGLWEDDQGQIIKVSFDMEIEGLLKSELMQVMSYGFGQELVRTLLASQNAQTMPLPDDPAQEYGYAALGDSQASDAAPPSMHEPAGEPDPEQYLPPAPARDSASVPPPNETPYAPVWPDESALPSYAPLSYAPPSNAPPPSYESPVGARAEQSLNFAPPAAASGSVYENLELIVEVPLQVTAELGKARKSVKEVLDFNAGSVIVLDKLAGEFVEVIVNGKLIARGEVVSIDENFGVRLTEIVAR